MKVQQTNFDDKNYFCAYKVVRADMTSLGLRKNPNIMTFHLDDWIYLPEEKVVEGIGDYGGIWLARTEGSAHAYKKYMKNKHSVEARIFLSLIDRVLFVNEGRVKTNGVRLIKELGI